MLARSCQPVTASPAEAGFDVSERLYEALAPPDDIAAAQSERIDNLVRAVAGLCLDPVAKEHLALMGEQVKWEWYGRRGQPLPEGSLIERSADNPLRLGIGWDSTIGVSRRDMDRAEDALQDRGLNELKTDSLDYAINDSGHMPEVAGVLKDAIRRSEQFALLKAFDTPVPSSIKERPLTPYWRAVHEETITGTVYERHGLSRDVRLEKHTPAWREQTTKIFGLDEATMPVRDTSSRETAAADRARQYFMNRIKLASEATGYDVTDVYVPGDDKEDNEYGRHLTVRLADGSHIKAALMVGEVERVINEELRTLVGFELDPAETLISNFIDQLFRLGGDMSYQEMLDRAVVQAQRDFIWNRMDVNGEKSRQVKAWLLRPAGDVYEDVPPPARDSISGDVMYPDDELDGEVLLGTLEHIVEGRNQVIGNVLKGQELLAEQTASRIIPYYDLADLPKLPAADTAADMVIRFTKSAGYSYKDSYVRIPGFDTTAYDAEQNIFYFKRSAAADPYRPALVPIGAAGRAELAASYRELGLEPLAAELEQAEHLTVKDLARLISQYSDYVVSHPGNPEDDSPYLRTYVHRLSDFGKFVKAGRLMAQCTGASLFLGLSLQRLFGRNSAAQLSGYTLRPSSSVISGVGHVQTIFSHDGETYILDATATTGVEEALAESTELLAKLARLARAENAAQTPANTSFSFRRMLNAIKSRPPKPDKPPKAKRPKRSVEPELIPVELPKFELPEPITQEEHLEDAKPVLRQQQRQVLEEQLIAAFGVRSPEQLYKRLMGLKSYDPVRKVLKASMTMAQTPLGVKEVDELAEYIQNYESANLDRLAKLGMTSHSAVLMSTLRGAVGTLRQLTV